MPLEAVIHFLVEVFIIISHDTSHCICTMHHVLTHSCTRTSLFHVTHLLILVASMNTHKSLYLSCFSFTRNSITVHWQTNVTDSHIFSQYTLETLIRRHITGCIHLYIALMCITELSSWLCMTIITWNLLIFSIFTYTHRDWWLEWKAWTVVRSAEKQCSFILPPLTTVAAITVLKK